MADLFGKRRNYVKYGDSTLVNYGDFHTHTVYSLHGMSSPSEMVDAAIEAGLEYIALTDHHINYDTVHDTSRVAFFQAKNQEARAYEINRSFASLEGKIKVIPGYEYNLFVTETSSCFIGDNIPHLRNIGYHTWYCNLEYLYKEEFLGEINERLASKKYKIFVHPERDIDKLGQRYENLTEDDLISLMGSIVRLCKKYGVLIECNNSSIANSLNSKEKTEKHINRMKAWIKAAKKEKVKIVVNSDAHVKYDIGCCYEAFKLLESMSVDKSQIVNFDRDMIEELLVP